MKLTNLHSTFLDIKGEEIKISDKPDAKPATYKDVIVEVCSAQVEQDKNTEGKKRLQMSTVLEKIYKCQEDEISLDSEDITLLKERVMMIAATRVNAPLCRWLEGE